MFPPPTAYDRAITVFSPDGRILQVEYATETVKRGAPGIGIQTVHGVILVAHEPSRSPLVDPLYSQKLLQIDEHIGVAAAGLSSDARVLIDVARQYAQIHRLIYDEPIPIEVLARRIGDIKQAYTQHAGVRPFGVCLLFGGVDSSGPSLFVSEPAGIVYRCKAKAVGRGSEEIHRMLLEEYREDMTLDEALLLGIRCLLKVIERTESSSEEGSKGEPKIPLHLEIRAAVIPTETRQFRLLGLDETRELIEKIKSSS
ncbi:archaeal proteasome endopeptidase complex subunit alpha [archaeon]|nr:archaeal proteasome endopeptidase complex subunit alpha [archaeon]